MWLWGWLAMASVPADPSDQTLVYYNARMALREGRPLEATKLWLLRNAIEDHTGQVSTHDEDFHSVTWAALGALGICQDGHPRDTDGVGLWPVAMHNWVVRNRSRRGPTRRPNPFDAFEVGRQQRFVAIDTVLGSDELSTVRLFRGRCLLPRLALIDMGALPTAELSDRQVGARLLEHLLYKGRDGLDRERVRGTSVIDARLFDIHLQLTSLAAQEARRKARAKARRARQIGMSRESIEQVRDEAPTTTLDPDSRAAEILRECVDWPVDEWMALSDERRLFLYHHAREYGGDSDKMRALALDIVDALVVRGDGGEVARWIARVDGPGEATPDIWGGERGAQLLALDAESGFQERAVIALHRGVHQLEQGDLPSSLRSFAFALQVAPESRVADETQGLSLRWMSYVAAQFEISDELLVTLQELVPRRDYSVILEDLMWGATFRADATSFERGVRGQIGRGALERRISWLQPLARGNVGSFIAVVRRELRRSPSETLRFLGQMVERLELEDAGVRADHVPTLVRLRGALRPLEKEADGKGSQARRVAALMERTQAIVDGLGALDPGEDARDRARRLDPSGEVFAGAVRLAPSDALPWPFRDTEVPAPSVFTPIDLVPEEWRGPDGEWVFGWRLRG